MIKDYEDLKDVNVQLEKMGYNIGVRLVDEFAAKSGIHRCQKFKDTAEAIAKIGFKMFLGINVDVKQWNGGETSCHLVFNENPLADFAELPREMADSLWYSNMLCGILRGALEMVQMRVNVVFLSDSLRGDDTTEIRLEYKGTIEETMIDDYKDD